MTAIPFISRFIFAPAGARKIAALALTFSAILLAGCAGIAPQPDGAANNATQSASACIYHDAIDLDGRLSVQYQRNGEDESIHGSFTWRQAAQRSTIAILSPLGQILATIDVEPGNATLAQSGHASRSAPDVDELAAQALGWPLPVSGLRTWLQGFAVDAGGKPFIATPADTGVTTGDGWHIQYVTWDESDPAHIHPKRIDLERQTEQAGKVAIRIVIDRWQAQ